MDPIELLARDDKWYLGGGDGFVFAPRFPLWLDHAGFWDEANVFHYTFAPLFTVTILDDDGREIPMRMLSRRWTPAELMVEYRMANGVSATEVRTVQPGGIFASEWQFRALKPIVLHVVAWTIQDAATLDLSSAEWRGALAFRRTVKDRRDIPLTIAAELACLGGATSWAAYLSEASADTPHWRLTPFVEKWTPDGFPREVKLQGISPEGRMYGAVHVATPVDPDGGSATFAMRLAPADPNVRPMRAPERAAPQTATLAAASRRHWNDLYAGAPAFRCSDPYFEMYWVYRWYGLWMNGIAPGSGNFTHYAMCEGVGAHHRPTAFSAPAHVRELAWLHEPDRARGVFRTFFEHQRPDGSLHGRIYVNHLHGTHFYHADWGGALLALDAIAPSDDFIAAVYPRLATYAEWLLRTRDADGSGMIDVVDQFETGQEYMSRYQAVDDHADTYGWENRIRLKGIDVTVYAYVLMRALEQVASRGGSPGDKARWTTHAERIATAVRTHMWDAEDGMFSDVDPRTGERTRVRAAVCFYPYATDLVTAEHLPGLERHLLDPSRFWTAFPVPSSSLDDPMFSANAEWKGKRHGAPWNGRVWPMTNSHLVEALAHASLAHAPHLRTVTADLVRRFVHMLFHDGDLHRANCFEHYNPFNGHASVYRGLDDCQHSWVNDLIVRYVMGIRPHAGGITIDPFPFHLDYAELTNVQVQGRSISVRLNDERMTVTADEDTFKGTVGTPLEIPA